MSDTNQNRCDRCAHWQREAQDYDWEAKGAGFGLCGRIRERWEITDPARASISIDGDCFAAGTDALKAARAYVQDGSDYKAELLTAPDFFCALFERR